MKKPSLGHRQVKGKRDRVTYVNPRTYIYMFLT